VGAMTTRTSALVGVDELARLLGLSRATVYRSIARGDLPLPVYRINNRLRIPRHAVEELLGSGIGNQ
jgi:excisionase family DNA binding protein